MTFTLDIRHDSLSRREFYTCDFTVCGVLFFGYRATRQQKALSSMSGRRVGDERDEELYNERESELGTKLGDGLGDGLGDEWATSGQRVFDDRILHVFLMRFSFGIPRVLICMIFSQKLEVLTIV